VLLAAATPPACACLALTYASHPSDLAARGYNEDKLRVDPLLNDFNMGAATNPNATPGATLPTGLQQPSAALQEAALQEAEAALPSKRQKGGVI
jgi:hypothetical protein